MLSSRNSSSVSYAGLPEPGLASLQAMLRQQAQCPHPYEKVAIVGCGYIGTALAEQWQMQGHFVTGTTTRPERRAALQKVVAQAFVAQGKDAAAVREIARDQDTIVVSVAPNNARALEMDAYEATYLETARNLAKALSAAPKAQQIIYLSSCSVYGDRAGDWVDETTPVAPSTLRGRVLHAAERILLAAASERHKVCILRLGGIYGPGRDLIGMFGGLAGATLPGTGDRIVNWIHRDDILSAIEFARFHQLQGIFNLVDDAELTIRELINLVCWQYGLPKASWDASQPAMCRNSLRISNQKLKTAGYKLRYPQPLLQG